MNAYGFEDIDEDIDEADDEDIDEVLAGEDDESLAERRRKRRRSRVKGRGYTQPRIEKSYVSQTQLAAATTRIASDVRKLQSADDSIDKRIDAAVARVKRESAQSTQMLALLPLLIRPPTLKVDECGRLPPGESVLSGKQDSMAMMLPLLMMGGGFGGGTSTNGASGGMD